MEDEKFIYESLPLHYHPQYRPGCVEILCEEWGRGEYVRLSMLEKSCNEMPFNIVFLRKTSNADEVEVVGHSRLCRVHGQEASAFVESVVIRKARRGLGLGRKLMDETESHASRLGIQTLYLTTHDKQDFYHHLGYEYCKPIISLGSASNLLSQKQLANLLGNIEISIAGPVVKPENKSTKEHNLENGVALDQYDHSKPIPEASDQGLRSAQGPVHAPPPPPPVTSVPPPPCPPPAEKVSKNSIVRVPTFWMKKDLIGTDNH